MKTAFLTILLSSFSHCLFSQHYFVTMYEDRPQIYWSVGGGSYAGVQTYENWNLLASVLGDNPASLLSPNQTLVAREQFPINDNTSVTLQPFAYTTSRNSKKLDLPMGTNLERFLRSPLGGEPFDLTLPFSDKQVMLSPSSASHRGGLDTITGIKYIEYHVAIDFRREDRGPFDVIAPADGVVRNSANGTTIVIFHKTPLGKEFLTLYQHIDVASKSHWQTGENIKRGDKIGVTEVSSRTHLHFGVGVKGPSATVDGVTVPELWYLIDPFGVYDIRRNKQASGGYNYLPGYDNTSVVKGVNKAFVFLTNPITGSYYLGKEECKAFNPNSLSIKKNAAGDFWVSNGLLVPLDHTATISPANANFLSNTFSVSTIYRSFDAAGQAMQMIKRNGYTKSCHFTATPLLVYYK